MLCRFSDSFWSYIYRKHQFHGILSGGGEQNMEGWLGPSEDKGQVGPSGAWGGHIHAADRACLTTSSLSLALPLSDAASENQTLMLHLYSQALPIQGPFLAWGAAGQGQAPQDLFSVNISDRLLMVCVWTICSNHRDFCGFSHQNDEGVYFIFGRGIYLALALGT